MEVTVHEVRGQPGDYIVRLLQFRGGKETRRTRWLVTEADGGRREAEKLAKSVIGFVASGLPVEALFGEDG